MDFTLMIIFKIYGTSESGYSITSQLKSFPTRELAERIAQRIDGGDTKVIKLYI